MKRARGMTLIELMVAMTIGLGLTLAVTSMLIVSENHKRTTTSTNDAEQSGAYAFYALDRVIRSAGSAFAETAFPNDRGVLGCRVNAGAILPRAAAFPAPFAGFLGGAPGNLRIAPLVIAPGQSDGGSDVIVSMGGSGSAGGVPRQVSAPGSNTSLVMDSNIGFNNGDLLLLSQSGVADCLMEQVTASPVTPGTTLTIGTTATYHTTNAATTNLGNLVTSAATYITPLGNVGANNVQFMLYGVGTDRILYSFDLLQNAASGGAASTAIADGVAQMRALYGVADGAGKWVSWQSPTETAYSVAAVTNPLNNLMRKIVSVRISLLLRGQYYDKKPVSPTTLTLFKGLVNGGGTALQQVVNLNAVDQHYRYRVFEFTVPLRNILLLEQYAPAP